MATKQETQTRHSICANCQAEIHITVQSGQRWEQAAWVHDVMNLDCPATPELRFAIDATCPGCGYYEIGYSPDREEFVCSRCKHTQTERPKD